MVNEIDLNYQGVYVLLRSKTNDILEEVFHALKSFGFFPEFIKIKF